MKTFNKAGVFNNLLQSLLESRLLEKFGFYNVKKYSMEKMFFAKKFSLNPFSAETFPKLTVPESLISIKPSCSFSNLNRL